MSLGILEACFKWCYPQKNRGNSAKWSLKNFTPSSLPPGSQELRARVLTSYSPQTPTPLLPPCEWGRYCAGWWISPSAGLRPSASGAFPLLASVPITSSPSLALTLDLQSRPGRLSPAPTSAPPAAETSLLPPRSTWGPGARFPGVTGGEGSGESQVLSAPPFRTLRARRAFPGSQDGGAEGPGRPRRRGGNSPSLRQGQRLQLLSPSPPAPPARG